VTLFKAIKQESPANIWRNFTKLISGESLNYGSDFRYNIEYAYIIGEQYLFLKGWCYSKESATAIMISNREFNMENVDCMLPREDIFNNIEDIKHPKIGFLFYQEISNPWDKYLKMELFSETTAMEINITLKKEEDFNNLQLDAYNQYEIFKMINERITPPKRFDYEPLISIIIPVYNVNPKVLDATIKSVERQSYSRWELCIYDDYSEFETTKEKLKDWKDVDPRIHVKYGHKNLNISLASNEAIKMAEGEYVAFLDHDDLLNPYALSWVVQSLNDDRDLDVLYSDEDKISLKGEFVEPYFKPDFSLEHLRANNYMCHFLVVRKSLGDSIDWLRAGYEGAQDHDFVLRLAEKTEKIHRIPKVLYHWRKAEGSTALSHDEKPYALEAGKKAVEAHLDRMKEKAFVEFGSWAGSYKVEYEFDESKKLDIIIPFKDEIQMLIVLLDSIFERCTYGNYKITLVSNNSSGENLEELRNYIVGNPLKIELIEDNQTFNFSAINNKAAFASDADYLLFLNNDTKVVSYNAFKEMMSFAQKEDVGAVGSKLIYEDGTLQHASVILGINGVAGHAFKGCPDGDNHYYTDNINRNVSACTGACLMVKAEVFNEVGGFDEENLKIAFNDIDLCLKMQVAGYHVVYNPFSVLFHFESKSRGYEDTPEKQQRYQKEHNFMIDKWGDLLKNDPYYNPNLTKSLQDHSLDLSIKQGV